MWEAESVGVPMGFITGIISAVLHILALIERLKMSVIVLIVTGLRYFGCLNDISSELIAPLFQVLVLYEQFRQF